MIAFYEKISGLFSKRTGSSGSAVPVDEASYVVLDTELTGLDFRSDSIISIGALKMQGSSIDLGNTFYELINPRTEIKHESVVVHGITPSDVAAKPPIDTVICRLLDFCGNSIIVGHFISLDMGFINREMKRVCSSVLNNRVADTCKIYEWMKVNSGSFSGHYAPREEDLDLFSLAREYGVPISEGHNALSDAFITAQLFQRFLSVIPGLGVRTVGDLLMIGKP